MSWLVLSGAAVELSGQVPPGNVAGNTRWTARRAKPEIRLTPGKGLADLNCSVEDLIDGVVKSNKARPLPPKLSGPEILCRLHDHPVTWQAWLTAQVIAFVKGTRTAPQCGFSHRVMSVLTEAGVAFDVVNVLDEMYNPGLREAIKAYSQWPTIPQVYVNGDFVGGADILEELAQKGELQQLVRQ